MKKILVPVDFSEHSEYALQIAAKMAQQHGAEIVVLHMMRLSEAVLTKDDSQEFMEAQHYMKLAKKRFNMFLNRPWLEGIKIKETVQNYKIFGEINQVAKEKAIDLIVMGSHGTGGLSEIFVGSNTEKVVRTSEVPVLVIKRKIKDFKLKKIVFGFDFAPDSLQAYHKVLSFCEALKVGLYPLFVNLPGIQFLSTAQMKGKVDAFFNMAYQGQVDEIPKVNYACDYSVEKGIYNFAKEINADTIAVTTHGRSGLAHFFKGSIGEDLANHASLPVITFKI